MLRVGLTGGIASGKTTGGAMFVELDCHLIDSDQIRREIRGVKGFGDYATATMMARTGRYDFVPIDSAYMEFVTRWHFNGTKPSRREAEAVYESWGRWKHLAYWLQRCDD